mmetsp:Transcript_51674/g.107969  ORF Transcript_51674/g.107969 Transcript_51674/m.107969 type:complete len:151 (-) Transcript_51674:364-816(-)
MNPNLKHPDYVLFKGQTLDVGRLLIFGASDSVAGLAARYGTSLTSIYTLNNDLQNSSQIPSGVLICIIPNSCKGQASGEAAQAGVTELVVPEQPINRNIVANSEQQPMVITRCRSNSNTNGVLYSSALACLNQCMHVEGLPGVCSQAGST